MFEVINWIIFGLFTTALIADSVYALSCLLKTKTYLLLTKLLQVKLFLAMNGLCLLVFWALTQVKYHQLSLSSLIGVFIMNSCILVMVIGFNHGCPISDYKWQQKQANDINKQKTIKL